MQWAEVFRVVAGIGAGARYSAGRGLGNDHLGPLISVPLICRWAPWLSWSQKAGISVGVVDTGHLEQVGPGQVE